MTALHSILLALLAGLFLVIVNLWSWKRGDTHFLIDEKKKVIAFGFVTLAAILALFGDLGVLIPLLGGLFFLLLLAGLMQSSNPGSQKFVFFTLLSTNTIALIVVLINTPYIFWLLPVLTLGLIVLLNWRLYVFYMRQRGLVFTYAALHYQVLYYIYSMFAFMIGVSLHSWNTLLKAR